MDISVPKKTDLRKLLASLNKPTWFFWTALCQGISHTPQREENVGRENVADGNSPSAYRLQETLEFPESPLALFHGDKEKRRECPVLLGTGVEAFLGRPRREGWWKLLTRVCLFFWWALPSFCLGQNPGSLSALHCNWHRVAPTMFMKIGPLLYYGLDDCFFPSLM